MSQKFVRNCPSCNKSLEYASLKGMKVAEKLERICKSCSNVIKKTGKEFSASHKESLSKGLLGRKFSDEHKRKLSEASKGEKNAQFGKPGV